MTTLLVRPPLGPTNRPPVGRRKLNPAKEGREPDAADVGPTGWPDDGTFHPLRHLFATMLIAAGTDPTDVQHALRHATPRITLETYVHWWPKQDRRRNIISTGLRAAATHRQRSAAGIYLA